MRIFLVGCGRILPKHLESIKSLNKKFKLVGICDVNEKKIKKYSNKLNVPSFNLIEDGIDKTQPDIVSILTPSGMHADHAIRVLKKKKHVIIEKPMCLKINDAKKIIQYSVKQKRRVFVVMQNKFNRPVKKLIEDIKSKKFGRIFHTNVLVKWKRDKKYYKQDNWRGTWKYDGGVVCNQASHHLDLMRSIMGNPISVYAKGFKHINQIEAEDTALIIFQFRNGSSGMMQATTAMRPFDIEGSLSVMGNKGSAKIGGFALNEISYYFTEDHINIEKFKTNPKNVYGFGHLEFYKHVYHYLTNNKKSEFDDRNSYNTVKIINAIYKSIETKKEVFLRNNVQSKKLGK